MKSILKITTILIFLLQFNLSSLAQESQDYKYVRTYDANGRVIATAKYDEYISAQIIVNEFLGNYQKKLLWGLYSKHGDNWSWDPGPSYSFNQYNNGWSVWVSTIGYYSDYIYISNDLTTIRMTFMAGGQGKYKEYIRAKRPTIDRLAPTR